MQVITHMVVLGPAKRAYMRALGMWDPRASFRRDAHTKFLQVSASSPCSGFGVWLARVWDPDQGCWEACWGTGLGSASAGFG